MLLQCATNQKKSSASEEWTELLGGGVVQGGKVAFQGFCTAQEDSRGSEAAHPLRYEF